MKHHSHDNELSKTIWVGQNVLRETEISNATIHFLLKSVLVTNGDGGKFQGLVVVDFDVDVDGVAAVVNDPVDNLIGHHCGTEQHQ